MFVFREDKYEIWSYHLASSHERWEKICRLCRCTRPAWKVDSKTVLWCRTLQYPQSNWQYRSTCNREQIKTWPASIPCSPCAILWWPFVWYKDTLLRWPTDKSTTCRCQRPSGRLPFCCRTTWSPVPLLYCGLAHKKKFLEGNYN